MIFKSVYFSTRICVYELSHHAHIYDILYLFIARNDKNLNATKTPNTRDDSSFKNQFTKSAVMRKLSVRAYSEVYST
jgi:hypothetical protein